MLGKYFSGMELSNVYESEAVGFEGDPFYNLVVQASTDKPLDEVLKVLKKIEFACGRENSAPDHENRHEKNFISRTIDLDLLLYGNEIIHNEQTDIPRSDILEYAFVLLPLSEVAPNFQHPEINTCLKDLWKNFTGNRTGLRRIPFRPITNGA